MSRCEDFPCCGHENGCCPDYDDETGEQLNMICVCGKRLPVTAPYSICNACMNRNSDGEPDDEFYDFHGDYDD